MSASIPSDGMSPIKRALLAIETLQHKLDTIERAKTEPIAIIGMSCRFPGSAKNLAAFWQTLKDGVDAISEVPPERWSAEEFYDPNPDALGKIATRWGGFLENIKEFDPAFFGISPREAAAMDPQQRLVLECAWEALENAGQRADQISGSDTGVYIGVYANDFEQLQFGDIPHIDAYCSTGGSCNIIAGRLSYTLNLQGPSFVVDTACSSSLVALHLACQSLRNREIQMALTGGVNILLSPGRYAGASRMHMMASDGRCKTFDARADGFVRSEGCGMLVLKRLSDALKDGDPILALIRGSAVNQDGRSAGLSAPNGLSQQAVIRQALANAGLRPEQISYVEAHGTGTSLGDPIEVEALGEVYGRPHGPPCVIGSVKSNIGHLESAAGVSGIIKIILMFQHGAIPPNLHFRTLNPNISLENTSFEIPTTLRPWPAGNTPRIAGINSFGWSGTNVHVLLEEPPQVAKEPAPERAAYLLPLSTRNEQVLRDLAQSYESLLNSPTAPPFADICYTASVRRTHHDHRLAVVGTSAAEVAERLRAFLQDEAVPGIARGHAAVDTRPPVVMVFTGYGAQWAGMGRQLLAQEPVFREAIEACEAAFRPYVDWSLQEVLNSPTRSPAYDQSAIVQPTMFAMAVGLYALWQSWGVTPAAVVGHSMGEIAAAYVAGVLTLDQAARIICKRGQVMQEVTGQGTLGLVELPVDEVEAAIAPYAGRLAVTGINSRRSVLIGGDADALDAVLAELGQRDVFCRRVKIDVASHSPQMEPLVPMLRTALGTVEPQAGQVPFYSTVEGRVVNGRALNTEYWVRNMRAPVRFVAAVEQLLADGYTLFLEVSAHPVLLPSIVSELRERGVAGTVLPSLRRESDELTTLLGTLGALYCHGYPVEWERLYPQGRCVSLPNYPWQRECYWKEARRGGGSKRESLRSGTEHPLLGVRVSPAEQPGTHYWEIDLSLDTHPYLADHKVQGMVVLPGAAYLELAQAGARDIFRADSHAVSQVQFTQMLTLEPEEVRTLQLRIVEQGESQMHFTIFSRPVGTADGRWMQHAEGRIQHGEGRVAPQPIDWSSIQAKCGEMIAPTVYYETMAAQGLQYGPNFQGVAEVWRRDGEALARLEPTANVRSEGGRYMVHPALLDACFQALGAAMPQQNSSGNGSTLLPIGVGELCTYRAPISESELWTHALVRPSSSADANIFEGDLFLLDSHGQVLLDVRGLRMQRIDGGRAEEHDPIADWLYALRWEKADIQSEQEATQTPGSWLLLTPPGALGERLAALFADRGQTCVVVSAGADYRSTAPGRYQIDPKDSESFVRLLREAFADTSPCRGVVHMWGLEESTARGEDTTPADLAAAQELGCASTLALVQALARVGWRTSPRTWLVTRGTQAVSSTDAPVGVTQASLWGLGGTIVHEYPELRCTRVDLGPTDSADETQALFDLIWADDSEDQVALRPDGRYVARLIRYRQDSAEEESVGTGVPAGDQPFRLEIARPGVLDRLVPRAIERRQPGPGEVEIRIEAAGLNFIDVLRVLGNYPGQEDGPVVPGSECSGVITAVGPGVEGFAVGDEVVACAYGGFSTHIITTAEFVTHKPSNLSFEEAAGLPIIFMTVYFGLHHLARLAPGEKILIHSAASGTGLAAVQYAQHVGAEIFATAGTAEKRAFLESLGVQHVMDSRTLAFADEIMERTNGQGIDVVLNSLAGEAIPKSMGTLGMYGRFVELGKKDIYGNGHLDLSPFRRSLSYFAVDLVGMRETRPAMFGSLLREVMQMFADGTFRPQPVQVFPISRAADAFRTMAQGRHIGKIVVSMQDREQALILPAVRTDLSVRPDATYLITGGLGGIGLRMTQWLVDQGARSLALVGRSGPSAEAQAVLDDLIARGVQVQCLAADVSDPAAVTRVLETVAQTMPPLRGVIHGAAVLDDGVLLHQTPARFARVFAPKATGAWNLHLQTQGQALDFFVLFSSVAALLGSPSQGNYAAANAFLDGLAHYRRARGLPALSVNWGPWAEVGMAAAQANRGDRLSYQGMGSIPPAQGFEAMGRLMKQGVTQAGVMPLNLRQWRQFFPKVARLPIFTHLLQEQDLGAAKRQSQSSLRATLEAAEPSQRRALLEAHIYEQVSAVLRLPSGRFDRQTPVGSLGLDSLMALELRNRLEDSLGLNFPVTLIWNYQTVAALTTHLAEKLQLPLEVVEEKAESPFTTEQGAELAALLGEIDKLSLDELQQSFTADLST